MSDNGIRAGWFGIKGLVVVVVGALGLGALFYGSGIGTETSKNTSLPATASQAAKPVRAMNLALGPMVFLARELDFAVKNAKGEKVEDSRVAARVETQLLGLRDLYRREVAKNPKLIGSMILQFNVNPAGQVSQVKEINARLSDPEFKQTVAAETGKWTFAELVAEPVTVQLPLLFVEEGMDITTLVRWESRLAGAPVNVVAAGKSEPVQQTKAAAPAPQPIAAKPAATPEKAAPAAVKSEGEEVQIKYATLLRKEPNFSAPVLITFTIGTKVTVINRSSDWLEVRSHHNGQIGYIRKEFVVPVEVVVNR